MRALFLATLLLSASIAAQERILDFQSDIQIAVDGSLTVTETITVQAEGQTIKRGILRDFPTDYRDRLGNAVTVPFEVQSVLRNGAAEPWRVDDMSNGKRIRIGDANVFLPRGAHEYRITYRTARQLGFFNTHDELYWNVTGNGWTFAIDRASARVQLPQPIAAAQLQAEAFTGPFGARGRDYTAQVFDGGGEFVTTRRLAPREGFTLVLSFPKGIVTEPTAFDRIAWFLRDNRGAAAGVSGLLLIFGGAWWRWRLVGRDPKAGPRFPRYEPPPGMGAAAVRFVDRMNFDSRCFAASVLGLGSRGWLRVDQRGDDFSVARTGTDVPHAGWLPGEAAIARELFIDAQQVDFKRTHDPRVTNAQNAMSDALQRHYQNVLFKKNTGSVVLIALAGAAAIGLAAALGAAPAVLIAMVVVLVLAVIGFARWMPAYTLEGRRLQDHIEGLRQYLGVAERDDLRRMKAPELTPHEFARMLPYALALDVEKTWADRFAVVAGSAAVAAAVSSYYATDRWGSDSSGVSGLADGLSAMDSTVSSAATPPGSESGSSSGGGGGGSGGGGGGGGGSGW